LRRVDCCFDADFFAEVRLETRAIVSFGDIDSGVQMIILVVVVVMRTVTHEFEFPLVMVLSVMARELYVDVGSRVFSENIC
jgi:hypothetical protein